jgi:alpha/beta hydrolase family protein
LVPPVPAQCPDRTPWRREDVQETKRPRHAVDVLIPAVNFTLPYTGWNIRKAGFSQGDSSDLTGAFIPFFKTRAQRLAAGDPRLSLEERYPSHADYVNAVTAAANGLLSQRLLLPVDAASIIAAANAAAVP